MSDKSLKILHLVAGEVSGGAARGAYWLHKGLKGLGVDSKILTTSRETLGDENIISISQGLLPGFLKAFRRYLDLAFAFIHIRRQNIIFSTGFVGPNLLKRDEFNNADIIHLHWVNNGFFDIKYLRQINKPVIWTVRDMWPMTGGCHMADYFDCDRYKDKCGTCKQLRSQTNFDLSRLIWKRKKKYYTNNMKIVGISDWIAQKAKESSLFNGFDVRRISNNIDAESFCPVDKSQARRALGINTHKKIILAGAAYIDVPWKGFAEFQEALQVLDPERYFLCFFGKYFGRDTSNVFDALGFENKSFGFIDDDKLMRHLYSGADVFVSPSIIEPFGKTIAESMACGTPVVCFDSTGPKDIVDHKINGYKAIPYQPEELAQGIEWVTDSEDYDAMSRSAREKVLREFDLEIVAKQYLELYKEQKCI